MAKGDKSFSLETLIRDAAARGDLTHLSVVGSWGKDRTVIFKARVAGSQHNGYGEDADPIKALGFAFANTIKGKSLNDNEPDFG